MPALGPEGARGNKGPHVQASLSAPTPTPRWARMVQQPCPAGAQAGWRQMIINLPCVEQVFLKQEAEAVQEHRAETCDLGEPVNFMGEEHLS